MRALEVIGTVDENQQVHFDLPPTVKLPSRFRAIILISAEDEDWSRLTAQQFAAGYAEADAIYDRL